MGKLPLLTAALGILAIPAFATDDPIATRQALMAANGGAAAVTGALLKDQIAYAPVVGKSVFTAFSGVSHAVGDYFPEGSLDAAKSAAAPAIWEDPAGFQAEMDKFDAAVAAALEASGKDGPADKAAFAALAQPVMKTCGSCHETFRIKND